ncbi:MAG: glycosyltransferase family 4 protein [Pseudomonadota bacterium]
MTVPLPDLSGRTILQVIPDLAAGGAERTVIEIGEALAEAGARALVVSRGGRMAADLLAAGGELVEMNVATKNPIAMRANAGRLARLIRGEGVDLIHARSRAPAWSALGAARRTQIPYVTTYHGVYSAKSVPKRFYNGVMARGDRVIANSDYTAAHVRAEHGVSPDRLVTIHRGVDVAAFDPARVAPEAAAAQRRDWFGGDVGAAETVVLLPGRLTRWKGQLAAIAAIAGLPDAMRAQVRLVLLGDAKGREAYAAELAEAITQSGLDGLVRIAPHTSDMATAYAVADLVLVPSSRPEAFGRTAAEASAMEKPVIAFAHGGALETVIDGVTGRLVPLPGAGAGVDGLTSALIELMSAPPERCAAMGAAGRAHILHRFTKRGLQAATLTVYAELLNTRSGNNRPRS